LDTISRVVLVSSNAAKYFFSRIKSSSCGELTAAILDKIEFAAIGAATADAAVAEGFEVNLVPDRSDSAALADLLEANPTQGRTMVIRANRGSPVLADRLQQAGCLFEQFPVYQSRDVREVPPEVKQQMRQGKIDWTTVTSSAIGGSLLNLFGIDLLKRTRLASISPTTTAALESLGLTVDAEAVDYSMEGLVTAIVAKAKA
jgi:uroporphyrinogen-III synthase